MKKYILPIFSLFICLVASQTISVAQTTPCVEIDECFEFTYHGPTYNPNETVTLNFSVQVNCDNDLSYAAFELPGNAKASAYSSSYHSTIENTTNSPFYSIKFELTKGYKNGTTGEFSYTVTAAQFATMTEVRVQAKAGNIVGTVTFNPQGCGEEGCPAGESITGETVAGSDITITYQGSTVAGANTTVSFAVASEETIDQLFIQPLIFDPTSTTVTATANNGYAPVYDASTNNIIYTQGVAGSNNLLVSFTIPTNDFAEVYGLRVLTTSGGGISTTYTGREGDVQTCEFGDLTPLAAELVSFSGKATASGVELTWATASEKDNDRFEVQRSTNGKDFKAIGTVKGAGNSSTALSYSFSDKNPGKGTNYYRLGMIETNGSIELSNVIAIENSNTTTSGISLYPNPATGDNLTITLNGSEISNRDFIISISDINGRKAFEQKFTATGSDEIKLSLNKLNISKGLYLVKVLGENMIETHKLLIK